MNESDLETELRALQPARPSPSLEAAIARELSAEPRTLALRPTAGIIVRPERRRGFNLWRGFGWAFAGAAAAFAVLASIPTATHKGAEPASAKEAAYFEPLESAREFIAADQSEILYDGEDGPAQLVRYSSVERHSWTNPTTGALVELEVPREDLFLVPVSYQ
jgi:hypothetical protein